MKPEVTSDNNSHSATSSIAPEAQSDLRNPTSQLKVLESPLMTTSVSDFLKKNPAWLRHCVLYAYLKNEDMEKSFNEFNRKIGKEFVDFEKFKNELFRFEKSRINERSSEKKMLLREDDEAVRACILYESLKMKDDEDDDIEGIERCLAISLQMKNGITNVRQNESVFGSYRNMCKALGDDVIDYPNFFAYFHKFSKCEFDLEAISHGKPIDLTGLPIVVMRIIGDELDFYDRAALRKVNVALRLFVGDFKFKLAAFHTIISKVKTTMGSGSTKDIIISPKIEYFQNGSDCKVKFKNAQKTFKDMNHLEMALNDLKILFENPKFELKGWELNMGVFEDCTKFHEVFGVMTSKMCVEKVEFKCDTLAQAKEILPLFKSRFLKQIVLEIRDYATTDNFQNILMMDQWKQAKTFYMEHFAPVPIENLFHFEKFTVGYPNLTMEDVEEIKQIFLKNTNFKSAKFCHVDSGKVSGEMLRFQFGNPVREDSNTIHFSIPNSKDYIEIAARFFEEGDDPHDFMTGNTLAFTRQSI